MNTRYTTLNNKSISFKLEITALLPSIETNTSFRRFIYSKGVTVILGPPDSDNNNDSSNNDRPPFCHPILL